MLRRGRRLRVGILSETAGMSARSGHGRVWSSVLAGLASRVRLDVRERDGRRGRRPDVWLADGHRPLPTVEGEPLVVQLHEATWRDPELAKMLDPAFAQALDRNAAAAVEAASVVLTGAESARRDLVAAYGVPSDAIVVVPHGVDLERFRPGLGGGSEIVAEAAPAHRGAPYVAFVGVLHPRKGLPAVRAAIGGLAREGLPHVLAVVGAPAGDRADPSELEREALADLPDAPGRIARLRALSDDELARVLSGADAFCLPSLYEGFGLPCLEALACGVPVVVSDRGALPELVGDSGLVVAPDAASVEAGLRRALTEPGLADELRARARARAESFPWSRTVDGWLAALERAAANP